MFCRAKKFYMEVIQEFNKVVWPGKQELITTTIVVIASVILMSALFVLVDYVVHNIVEFILKIGK